MPDTRWDRLTAPQSPAALPMYTPEEVALIREAYAKGRSYRNIADILDCSHSVIARIIRAEGCYGRPPYQEEPVDANQGAV